ncbi:MAG: hypothetical protein AABY34_06705 [Pseudomonadota bacterium]
MAILQQGGQVKTIEMLPDPTQVAHVARIFQLLQDIPLSTDDRNTIRHYPEQAENICEIFEILERTQALNAKNISALLQSPEQTNIMKWAFEILEHAQLLNADHLNAILQSPEKIGQITWLLKILQRLQLVNTENLAIILFPIRQGINCLSRGLLFEMLNDLENWQLLTLDRATTILKDPKQIDTRALALSMLKVRHCINPKSVDTMIRHPEYAEQIENIFDCLRETQLDSPQRKITLLKHPEHSKNIIKIINILQRVRLFNSENLDKILEHIQQSAALQEALQSLEKAEQLSQQNFKAILSRPKEALFIAKKLGAPLNPTMPITRDFMSIRETAHLLLLAKCAAQRQRNTTTLNIGHLPPEILFDISAHTGTGALDKASAITTARGHYPTPT